MTELTLLHHYSSWKMDKNCCFITRPPPWSVVMAKSQSSDSRLAMASNRLPSFFGRHRGGDHHPTTVRSNLCKVPKQPSKCSMDSMYCGTWQARQGVKSQPCNFPKLCRAHLERSHEDDRPSPQSGCTGPKPLLMAGHPKPQRAKNGSLF